MNALLASLLLTAADPTAADPADGARDAVPAAPQPPPAAPAQAPGPPSREVYELHLAVDIPVTVVAGSAGLVRILFEDSLARKTCPCDPSGINRLDRGTVGNHNSAAGIAADVTVYGVMAALPIADLLDLGFKRALAQDLMVYAETIAVDTALQNAANFIVARPRPRTYAGDPNFVGSGEGYLSFYAGHVSTTFAALSMAAFTIRHRYGEQVWPWIVVGLVGASVAVERVASGHHFPTDVAAGAVAGTAVGITVPWLHLRREPARLSLTALGAHGLGIAGTF
jgi:membrane-associated phospholipid phosphatase